MKISNIAMTAAFAVLVSAGAYAQDVTLKLAPTAGTTAKYKIKGEMNFNGENVTLTMTQISKIKSIAENGDVSVEQSTEDGKAEIPSMGAMDIPGSTMTIIMDKFGAVKETKGEQAGDSENRMQNMQSFVFPDKAIKMGEGWSVDIKGDSKKGTVDTKLTYTVLATEKVDKWDCVKVKFEAKETKGDTPQSASGTYWIDAKDGSLVKADYTFKDFQFAQAPTTLSGKMTINRVP